MSKRIFAVLLVLCLLVTCFSTVASAVEMLDNGLVYTVHGDYVGITGYTGTAAEVVIPGEIEGLPVVYIGEWAFAGCSSLTRVEILDGVSSIHWYAFSNCKNLKTLILPSSLNWIQWYALQGCSSLDTIIVDEENPEFYTEDGVLYHREVDNPEITLMRWPCNKQGDVVIPENVSSIHYSAFAGCSGLTSIKFPSGLRSLGCCAFVGCENLKEIYFTGDAPNFRWHVNDEFTSPPDTFLSIEATVYYPADNATWTPDVFENYQTTCTWVPYTPEEPEPIVNPFTDVPEDSFYYEPVLWAVDNGITSGMTSTTFVPDANCTRGQVVTFLWRAAGSPEPTVTEHPFTDVKEGAYYYNAMLWAVENGITSGMTADTFAPDAVCTRGQVVTFLHRAKDKPTAASSEHPFTDVSETAFYYDAMLWAVEQGITSGMSADTFAPNNPCTRGQVVTFLYRTYAE